MSDLRNAAISPWQALQKDLARQFTRPMAASYESVEKPVSPPNLAVSWLLRARTRSVGAHRGPFERDIKLDC